MKDHTEPSDFERFDTAVNKLLSVSHDELKRREEKWKKRRKRKAARRTNAKAP